jgi:flagellar motor switch protein FliM
MSKTDADKLSREKIQQLLAAVGTKSKEDTSHDSDVTDYDWRQPRYFKVKELTRIKSFAETAAQELIEEFGRLYQSETTVSVVSAEQRSSGASDEENQQGDYHIPFGADSQKPFGLVTIPKQSALLWTGRILGDAAIDKDSERHLSKLEESLLADIVSGLINAFSRAYGSTLSADEHILSDRSMIELQGSDELFEMVFEAKTEAGDMSAAVSFLMCCDKLETIAGCTAGRGEKLSEAQIRNAMLEHIHRVPVSVRVELAGAMLAFKDVMNLEVDDIVMLNKNVMETAEILVEGQTLFHGFPAQAGGNFAVVIV